MKSLNGRNAFAPFQFRRDNDVSFLRGDKAGMRECSLKVVNKARLPLPCRRAYLPQNCVGRPTCCSRGYQFFSPVCFTCDSRVRTLAIRIDAD